MKSTELLIFEAGSTKNGGKVYGELVLRLEIKEETDLMKRSSSRVDS